MKECKKILVGNVVKISGEKTVSVSVVRTVPNVLYSKNIKKFSKFLVHDEKKICKVGDKISFREGRPLSRRKHFFVVQIFNKLYDTARV
ncbi:MAG: 30S ribosomal protein S17 [Cytophagales bacterium]|jgi:small subunit ribosomal protein S17|nr:30S ribosomal protein S17 [Cytophagales bacterium]